MNTAIEIVGIFSALSLLMTYILMSHRLMRKPLAFIVIGFSLCIFSAFTLSIFDHLATLFQNEGNKSMFDIARNTFMLSITSLGGGLICAGITNKAATEHDKQVLFYKEKLRDIDDKLEEFNILRDKCDRSEGEIEFYNLMIAKKEFRRDEILSKIRNVETL